MVLPSFIAHTNPIPILGKQVSEELQLTQGTHVVRTEVHETKEEFTPGSLQNQ